MNICCKQENYVYTEVTHSDGTKHIKCTCKECNSYIGYIKREFLNEEDIRIIKSKNLL